MQAVKRICPVIGRCPECDGAERHITFGRDALSYLLEHNEQIMVTSVVCGHTWKLTDLEKTHLRKAMAEGMI
jgi:hypothetical protein